MTADPTIVAPAMRTSQRLRQLREAKARNPLALFRGTPPQIALWKSRGQRVLLRTGNQIGKTTAGLVLVLWAALGWNPYVRTKEPPVQIMIVCVDWTQSLAIQAKLWALCPKDELMPGQACDPKNGFGTKAPALEFRNGSVIRIRTENQGAKSMSGGTLDLILYDEPPKDRAIFTELERRFMRTGGRIVLTMTPINAKIDWLREACEAGQILDLHFECTPENLATEDGTVLTIPDPETGEVRPMDAAWIEEQRQSCDPREEPVRVDGRWEFRSDVQIFSGWDGARMAIPSLRDSAAGPGQRPAELYLGIDYGDDKLRTAAVLAAVYTDPAGDDRETRVWVLGEWLPDRPTLPEQDAEAVLGMLAAHGLRWSDLDGVFGDKKLTDASGRETRKSNGLMAHHVSRLLGQSHLSPPVMNAKRVPGVGRLGREGGLWPSVRWMNAVMLRSQWWLDASCVRVREAIETWDGTTMHKTKDALDALRYALVLHWAGARRRAAAPIVKTW